MTEQDPGVLPEGEERPPEGTHAMAIVRWALVALMAAAAVSAIVYAASAAYRDRPHAGAILYHCPMHPSIIQDHPGECPICGMTLVPSMAGDTKAIRRGEAPSATSVPGLSAIELSPERIQLMGMKTARAERQSLTAELRAVGYVAPTEKSFGQVQTRVSGWIEQLLATQTGERVRRGQVLATLYSPEILTAEQELLAARHWSEPVTPGAHESNPMTANLETDARRKLELLGVSARDIDELEQRGQPAHAIAIRAPLDGYITQKNALPGLYVQPGTKLFEIADLSRVWVLADIFPYDIERVRLRARARLTLAAYPDKIFVGNIQFIYPTVDPQTRTVRVRLELPNPDLKLRPGMVGDVRIELEKADGLVIPRDALVDTGEAQYVFVAKEGGRFEPRRVRMGSRAGDHIQVLEGLTAGETVVTTANFLIDSESRLRAAIEGQSSAAGPAGSAADGGK